MSYVFITKNKLHVAHPLSPCYLMSSTGHLDMYAIENILGYMS